MPKGRGVQIGQFLMKNIDMSKMPDIAIRL